MSLHEIESNSGETEPTTTDEDLDTSSLDTPTAKIANNTGKRFVIKVAKLCTKEARSKLGHIEFIVDYSNMSRQMQQIQRMGGKILSITEII